VIVNYRTLIVLKYKNKAFKLLFSVPFLDQLTNTKKVIQNLFNQDIKVFVLYDKIALFFAKIENDKYYRFIYAGLLGKMMYELAESDLFCLPTTKFDFANGTLIGLLDKKPYILYNAYGIQSLNLYPYANYVATINDQSNYVIVGGINNYFVQPVPNCDKLWICSYCFELQYQAPFFKTNANWGYVPLQTQILIPKLCNYNEPASGPTYILGFNNTNPTLVYLGNTQFLNTDNTIITFSKPIVFTDNPNACAWYVYPENNQETTNKIATSLYYCLNDQEMTIYKPTFQAFLNLNTGSTSISDLLYSTLRNNLLLKKYPPNYGSTDDDEIYDHKYCGANWYFLYYYVNESSGCLTIFNETRQSAAHEAQKSAAYCEKQFKYAESYNEAQSKFAAHKYAAHKFAAHKEASEASAQSAAERAIGPMSYAGRGNINKIEHRFIGA
jgi:hypothetical protein